MKLAHVEIGSDEPFIAEVVSDLGLEKITRYHVLEIDLSKGKLEVGADYAPVSTAMRQGEEGILVRIQNECFADSWGYEPVDMESVTWWLDYWQNSPEDVLFVRGGDEVIGYCWTVEKHEYVPSTGKRAGCIFMLGVKDSYRNTGLGRKLLFEGLRHLKRKGCETASINVDSRNKSAFNLYKSMGFKVSAETFWYQKIIR